MRELDLSTSGFCIGGVNFRIWTCGEVFETLRPTRNLRFVQVSPTLEDTMRNTDQRCEVSAPFTVNRGRSNHETIKNHLFLVCMATQ